MVREYISLFLVIAIPLFWIARYMTRNLKKRPRFNVRDYGAIGDGSADDTTAIKFAISEATWDGGGVVYFPKGIYGIK